MHIPAGRSIVENRELGNGGLAALRPGASRSRAQERSRAACVLLLRLIQWKAGSNICLAETRQNFEVGVLMV